MSGRVHHVGFEAAGLHGVAVCEEAVDLGHLGRPERNAKAVDLHLHAFVEKQVLFVNHRRCAGGLLHRLGCADVIEVRVRVHDRLTSQPKLLEPTQNLEEDIVHTYEQIRQQTKSLNRMKRAGDREKV